jgi:hypothetical protein
MFAVAGKRLGSALGMNKENAIMNTQIATKRVGVLLLEGVPLPHVARRAASAAAHHTLNKLIC